MFWQIDSVNDNNWIIYYRKWCSWHACRFVIHTTCSACTCDDTRSHSSKNSSPPHNHKTALTKCREYVTYGAYTHIEYNWFAQVGTLNGRDVVNCQFRNNRQYLWQTIYEKRIYTFYMLCSFRQVRSETLVSRNYITKFLSSERNCNQSMVQWCVICG